eukprot:TRINITY_DN41886_c0_g1_i1.p1 TRINITY_DN41886_c0_g1~~TRINITY_DN41886_c0_g1_i1.p1  ORF type:complete len:122 (+),score=7.54 TRINITY_DN41886_c0_g1_i1:53-367(+)
MDVASCSQSVQSVIDEYNKQKGAELKYFQMAYQTMAGTSTDLMMLFRFVKEKGYQVSLQDTQILTDPTPLLTYGQWLENVIANEKSGKSPFVDEQGKDIRSRAS